MKRPKAPKTITIKGGQVIEDGAPGAKLRVVTESMWTEKDGRVVELKPEPVKPGAAKIRR